MEHPPVSGVVAFPPRRASLDCVFGDGGGFPTTYKISGASNCSCLGLRVQGRPFL